MCNSPGLPTAPDFILIAKPGEFIVNFELITLSLPNISIFPFKINVWSTQSVIVPEGIVHVPNGGGLQEAAIIGGISEELFLKVRTSDLIIEPIAINLNLV